MAADTSLPILIVDDLGPVLRILRKTLTKLGFRSIDDASCTGEALGMLRSGAYSLVICDGDMQPADAGDLVAEMRADAALWATPVIVVTAAGTAGAAMAPAATATVVKPIDATALKRSIDKALSGNLSRRDADDPLAATHHTSSA